MVKNTDWQLRAACLNLHHYIDDAFYDQYNYATFKAVCMTCPVRDECLEYANFMETMSKNRYGVWGGMTPKERNDYFGTSYYCD